MIRLVALTVLCGVVAHEGAPAQEPAGAAIADADSSARAWFALLADHNYAASWERADRYFREHVTREQWRVNASALDRQFGRAAMRKLIDARWLRDQPPLPVSEYVVLRWLTVIDDWHEVGERVIMAHEPDGSWRPATYDLYPNVDGTPIIAGTRSGVRPPPGSGNGTPPARTIAAPRKP